MGRKRAREGAMCLIYNMDMIQQFDREVEELFLRNFEFDAVEEEYIKAASVSIIAELAMIDEHIVNNLKGWKLDRLAKVDLSVLRIAIYEILFRDDIPKEVSVNEAIEIVKKYSAEDSYKFVNGVLGGVISNLGKVQE